MVENGCCAICLAPAEQKCSNCQSVHYCSRDHQKQHWKTHKYQCIPVRVKVDPKYGRYLEATRNIKAGDIILREAPLITGPSQVTPPVCLGCYNLLEEGKTVSCEMCGWPMCSEACSQKDVHKPECFYTQNRGEKVKISTFGMPHPNYQCITVLRCLYQRDRDQSRWARLQALEAHCAERRGTDKWHNDRKMILDFIWSFFKLQTTFSEEEIMKCCGIIQINGHEVPLTEPEHVAVFDRVSMAEHSCRANCNKSFTSAGDIVRAVGEHITTVLTAGEAVARDARVSVCYTDPLWGSEARRHHLADSKFFECACVRCADVTELGTMFSAVKCRRKDCKGYLLPDTFLVPVLHKTTSPDPRTRGLDDKLWRCGGGGGGGGHGGRGGCGDAVSDAVVQQLLQDIGRELSALPKGDPDACEKFLAHCGAYLHPAHHYLTDAALALAQLLGQDGGLAALADDRLLLKTQLCQKITQLLEVLAPAESRLRGSLLFELHAAVAESGRRRALADGPGALLGYLDESRKILCESARLLQHEPPELPEGALARQARANLRQLDALALSVSSALPSPL